MSINLAADLGFGIDWLMGIFTTAVILSSIFLFYVVFTTKLSIKKLEQRNNIKQKLFQLHLERYWAIASIFILGSLLALGYSWSPPMAFESGIHEDDTIHRIDITAGQWYWKTQDGGHFKVHDGKEIPLSDSTNGELHVKAGETLKFVAVSEDVTHGFGVLRSDSSMDVPLFQMQVVPGYDNIFYYTFKEPGTYTIRCLEYCGWFHPYMTSQIIVS